jgi:hypothetical protein
MRLSRYARAFPGHATEGDAWPAWVPAGARRRLDPLTRLACAAIDRLLGQGGDLHPDTAVLVATSYGAVESTYRFAQSIAQFGDAGGSPTPFTTSVHNSCAAAVGELLRLRGPTTTVSQGATGPIAALRFASRLVETGRAPAALVLAGERHNDWSRRVVAQLSGARWPTGDGLAAALVEPGAGPGRLLSWSPLGSSTALTGGVLTPSQAALVAADRCAADHLGCWWPGCGLAGLAANDGPLTLVEAEGDQVARVWFAAPA